MFVLLKRSYNKLCRSKILKYTLVTNTVFGITLRGFGDLTQQNIEIKSKKKNEIQNYDSTEKKIDWIRTKNISASGLVIAPLTYYWYVYLDKLLPQKTLKIISKKILLDQLVGATCLTFLFIVIVCLLEGKTLTSSLKEFNEKFLYIYMVDWLVWPPAQAINFYLVPAAYRVVYVNLLIVCWNVFMSYAKFNEI